MRQSGVVKSWDQKKGYGFIDVKGHEIYTPQSELIDSDLDYLNEGDRVVLSVVNTEHGPIGKKVRRLEKV